jgi:hypothetical protein
LDISRRDVTSTGGRGSYDNELFSQHPHWDWISDGYYILYNNVCNYIKVRGVCMPVKKLYIVDNDMISELQWTNISRLEFIEKIRSHPYQSEQDKEAHEHGWFTDWEMKEAELRGYNKGNADGMAYGRKSERDKVLDELMKYINKMYPVPPETGDYLYPSRKGRREVYDQIRGKIKELRQQAGEP